MRFCIFRLYNRLLRICKYNHYYNKNHYYINYKYNNYANSTHDN